MEFPFDTKCDARLSSISVSEDHHHLNARYKWPGRNDRLNIILNKISFRGYALCHVNKPSLHRNELTAHVQIVAKIILKIMTIKSDRVNTCHLAEIEKPAYIFILQRTKYNT